MGITRTQGRPSSTKQQFDRGTIIEKIREAMKRTPRIELQRRDIAELAGISPALINYYFPDKWQMLEVASLPVIEGYIAEISELVDSETSIDLKFRRLIRLYLTFNKDSGYLLEYYILAMDQRRDLEGIGMLWKAHSSIIGMIDAFIKDGSLRSARAELINSILWSVCKYVANSPQKLSNMFFDNEERKDFLEYQSTVIYSLLMKGLEER